MKKILALLMAILTFVSLAACGGQTETPAANNGTQTETPAKPDLTATEEDKAKLETLYEGLQPHHGQSHDHANTPPWYDGKQTLTTWLDGMDDVGIDFVAFMDHRQTHHLYEPEWDNTLFIGGSEAMTYIQDRDEKYNKYHYNMFFRSAEDMETFLKKYILEYQTGQKDGHTVFQYLPMHSSKFTEIIQYILDNGGYFVIPHPSETAPEISPDPMEYYFCDFIGYEVIYHYSKDANRRAEATKENYAIWTGLLANDKRVYCAAGCDRHNMPENLGLTTVYTAERLDTAYIDQFRVGNYAAGPVGIRMCIGDTLMGSTGTFAGQRVVVSVADFHKDYADPTHTYRVDVLTESGVVHSETVVPGETNYIAFDADENVKFYRVEIHDETLLETDVPYSLLALGNPIWNEAFYE